MDNQVKSPLVLLVLLIIVSLFLAGGVFFLLQKEKAKNMALQEELDGVKATQKATEARLMESKKIAKELDAKLQDSMVQIDKLNSDLQQEKTSREAATAKAEQLTSDLEQQKNLRVGLEAKLDQAQKEIGKNQAQLKELSSKKDELEKKLKDLEAQAAASKGVEIGKVIVTPESVPGPQAAQEKPKAAAVKQSVKATSSEGKVLVVNKEYNFAVLNMGSKDGVGMNDVFGVYHENKYVGDVKVEKLHDSMAAAGFSPDLKAKISEGDKVVLKNK